MNYLRPILVAVVLLGSGVKGTPSLYAQQPARIIEIHAHRFAFTPSEITITLGETVNLHLVSDDADHALIVPELKINKEISKGHPVDVLVTPDSAGEFHGMCGHFCGPGHGSMVFTIHVKE